MPWLNSRPLTVDVAVRAAATARGRARAFRPHHLSALRTLAMAEPARSERPGDKGDAQRMLVDTELEHLPAELRWREWMGRVEAVEYRAKWSLPADYPMVAPNYAAARSALAKTMGLGRKPKEPEKPAPAKRPRKKATA